jgi:hypothetical protein
LIRDSLKRTDLGGCVLLVTAALDKPIVNV